MAQCFISTYRNHYRLHQDVKKREPYKTLEHEAFKVLPPEDIWIEKETEEELDPETIDKMIQEARKKQLVTIYQMYYCRDPTLGASSENQLMKYCKNLYEPDSKSKVLPPLPSTRRIFGYIRPKRNHTPMTTYQIWIGKTGYEILQGKHRRTSEEKDDGQTETKNRVTCDLCPCCSRQVE